jgi:hypothetical protein
MPAVALSLYAGGQFAEAMQDLPNADVSELWHRFLEWTRS